MNQNKKPYEPPKAKIYRFDKNEQILTASGEPEADYAANALNLYLGVPTTTYEGQN